MNPRQHGLKTDTQRGFTYLGALFLLAIMSAVLASTGSVWHTMQMREKERDLLFVGDQFRRAIKMYYEKTPGAVRQYPKALEDMLKDSRYVTTQRYLRKIYRDPITVKPEWGLIEAPGGGIMGVYSLSEAAPIKTGNFKEADLAFGGRGQYSEWKFTYVPPKVVFAPTPPSVPIKK